MLFAFSVGKHCLLFWDTCIHCYVCVFTIAINPMFYPAFSLNVFSKPKMNLFRNGYLHCQGRWWTLSFIFLSVLRVFPTIQKHAVYEMEMLNCPLVWMCESLYPGKSLPRKFMVSLMYGKRWPESPRLREYEDCSLQASQKSTIFYIILPAITSNIYRAFWLMKEVCPVLLV